jgi:nitroimidazol reductase NimA-like FMN-containing flavoprotein (pyridoxamine 5'-phosphate oxidase superfamily)
MFPAMRQQKRELSRPEAEEILTGGTYGVLSLNGGDGYAYGVPLSYVFKENRIYLHCAGEGRKLTYLRRDNRVSFCVVGEAYPLPDQFSMQYRSAMVFGKASEVAGEEKLPVLLAFLEKYSTADYLERGRKYAVKALDKTTVLRIEIEHLTGKARK